MHMGMASYPLSMGSALRVEPMGDEAMVVILGDRINPQINDRVHQLALAIRQSQLPGVHDIVPAYTTVTVYYDPEACAGPNVPPHQALQNELVRLGQNAALLPLPAPRQVEIPVCYGGGFGPDLADVASRCSLSEGEVVARHTAAEYLAYMLGFAPGFAYMGGLDPSIASPRRETPRLKVPVGSVGIGGMQTGVYSLETPGGWQIIGRTPRAMFLPAQEEPCLFRPGDRVRFVAIDAETYRGYLENPS